ncbi:hypothetical protein KKH23_06525 [Patescibacteria group bacterium]|nr:hypothetical protein [Patescibacteria group bacterium]
MSSRRSPKEIIDAIYDALSDTRCLRIPHIAEYAGLDYRTTKRYLDLIIHIQSKHLNVPWLIIENFEDISGIHVGYRRATKRGRPKSGGIGSLGCVS